MLRRLATALDDPDFNFGIRSAPISEANSHSFHWYLAIVPRVSHVAGFELGSGIYINSVRPEDAAVTLRGAAIVQGGAGLPPANRGIADEKSAPLSPACPLRTCLVEDARA